MLTDEQARWLKKAIGEASALEVINECDALRAELAAEGPVCDADVRPSNPQDDGCCLEPALDYHCADGVTIRFCPVHIAEVINNLTAENERLRRELAQAAEDMLQLSDIAKGRGGTIVTLVAENERLRGADMLTDEQAREFTDDEVRAMSIKGELELLVIPDDAGDVAITVTNVEWLGLEVLRLRGELAALEHATKAALDIWGPIRTERDTLQATLGRVVEGMTPTINVKGKGDRQHCLRCDIWWAPGTEHQHRDWCPLADVEGNLVKWNKRDKPKEGNDD